MNLKLASTLITVALAVPAFGAVPVISGPSGSFALVQPLKQYRRQQTATVLSDGQVLVVGGEPIAEAATSELYDPVTGSRRDSGRLGDASTANPQRFYIVCSPLDHK